MANERPTLDTVAAASGVSRMTVSNAYNRPDQLAGATRAHVLEVARQLGYAGPNPTAASLRLRRTGTVGVVLTEQLPFAFADPGLIQILHGIATELSDAGNALLLVPAFGADGASLVRQALVDAIILCSLAPDDPAVVAALERQVPLVTVGYPKLAGVPCVGPDTRAATAAVAGHLLELGHRRFAVLTSGPEITHGPSRPLFQQRVETFRDALIAAGIAADRIEVIGADENSRPAGRLAARDLLSRPYPSRATAVFAVTDILALGVLDCATDANVAIPDGLSVVGFDDIEAAASSQPALTTIGQDLFGQGRSAARLARRLIAGESVRAPRVEAALIVRATTSVPGEPRPSSAT
jgi:DNA-binding LacI/PurR family transcriptional regulator